MNKKLDDQRWAKLPTPAIIIIFMEKLLVAIHWTGCYNKRIQNCVVTDRILSLSPSQRWHRFSFKSTRRAFLICIIYSGHATLLHIRYNIYIFMGCKKHGFYSYYNYGFYHGKFCEAGTDVKITRRHWCFALCFYRLMRFN